MVKKFIFLTSLFLLLKGYSFAQSNFILKGTVPDSIAGITPPLIQSVQQNNPNPFNERSEILFTAEENSTAQFKIYNLIGTVVQEYDIAVKKGINKVMLDARDLDSGIYYYALIHGSNAFTRKMIVKK